jgi:hypothetical protein
MHRFRSFRPSPSMVVALTALFLALGGVSYAATSLPRNSVGMVQLKSAAVTSAKLHSNAVNSSKVLNRSLLAADFKPGQIPKGPKGATGPVGPAGAAGLSGLVSASETVGPSAGSHSVTVNCATGKKAISGGWQEAGVNSSSNQSITQARIQTDGTSYRVDGKLSSGSDSWSLTAYIVCATVAT